VVKEFAIATFQPPQRRDVCIDGVHTSTAYARLWRPIQGTSRGAYEPSERETCGGEAEAGGPAIISPWLPLQLLLLSPLLLLPGKVCHGAQDDGEVSLPTAGSGAWKSRRDCKSGVQAMQTKICLQAEFSRHCRPCP
jgi:hypothetical protein